jgi:uncharacterized membrane protein
MRKQKTVLLLIVLNIFSLCLIAEEEGHRIRNMGIKTVGTYTGFVLGMIGGAFTGNTISQDNDSIAMWGAKTATLTVIGAICGTIAGKQVANKYIEHYYPEKSLPKVNEKPPLTDDRTSDRII